MQQVGNVFGESFHPNIKQQVALREYLTGEGFISTNPESNLFTQDSIERIQYLNSNTAWVKLISSVDIKDSTRFNSTSIKSLKGTTLTENKLAESFVLFGGVADTATTGLRGGLDILGENLNQPNNDFNYPILPKTDAYGVGGIETGFRPMPGIVDTTVEHLNNGTLRKAAIRIKAYNRAQFDIIDTLFLRLGYSVLLEWGHTIVAKGPAGANVNYIRNPDKHYSLEKLWLETPQNRTYQDYLDLVRTNRLASEGNYDGFVGRISNYSWNLQPDGTYDITLFAISVGDVIESLNMNSITDATPTGSWDNVSGWTQTLNLLESEKNKNDLAKFLYEATKYVATNDEEGTNPVGSHGLISFPIFPAGTRYDGTGGNAQMYVAHFTTARPAGVESYDEDSMFYQAYIRFGYLLDYIADRKIIVDKQKAPIVRIDTNTKKNLIPITKYTQPYDPSVCIFYTDNTEWTPLAGSTVLSGSTYDPTLIYRSYFYDELVYQYTDTYGQRWQNYFIDPDLQADGVLAGRLMNVYFNVEFVLKEFNDSVNNNQNATVSLQTFLQKLCDGYVRSTGYYNKLVVFLDEDTNTVKIIDKVTFKKKDKVIKHVGGETDYTTINIYGFDPVGATAEKPATRYAGNFVKNFQIKTELSKATSTTIAVGAAANGQNVLGEDSTAFSKWNEGLEDRVMKYFNGPTTPTYQELEKIYKDKIFVLEDFWVNSSAWIYPIDGVSDAIRRPALWSENVSSFCNVAKDLIQQEENDEAINNKTQNPSLGFLPIKISLTLQGISGMKILQEFKINTSFLPSNYPQALRFLITNIKHQLDNNKWTTVIETISAPESNPDPVIPQNPPKPPPRKPFPSEQKPKQKPNYVPSNVPTNSQDGVWIPISNAPTVLEVIKNYGNVWPGLHRVSATGKHEMKFSSRERGMIKFVDNPEWLKNVQFNVKIGNIVIQRIHKDALPSLSKMLEGVVAKGWDNLEYFENLTLKGLSVRTVNNSHKLSFHSYGFALDMNGGTFEWSQAGFALYKAALRNPRSRIHKRALVLNWMKENYVDNNKDLLIKWGGYGFNDPMHFTWKYSG